MRLRHLAARDNVDPEGWIIDPRRVRHGLVVAGRVADLAGEVDPLTHLNLDFAEHRLDEALVVAELAVGALVLRDGDPFLSAAPRPTAYGRLGPVDVSRRRAAWQQALAETPS